MAKIEIYEGDCLDVLQLLPDESAQMCVTSPPYWGLRDYGVDGQLGAEKTPGEYVAKLVTIFREVRRVLKADGTLWLNLGDCYATGAGSARSPGAKVFGKSNDVVDAGAFPRSQPNRMPIPGLKPKDMVGAPWSAAFALRADGWYLRSDIIWHKPNPMPESVRDRPTKAHEYLFLMAKSETYFYDYESAMEPATDTRGPGNNKSVRHIPGQRGGENSNIRGSLHLIAPKPMRNRRSVWTQPPAQFKGAHFATFPPELIRPCIIAGSRLGDIVIDPFNGSGTTGLVCRQEGRRYVGIELNPDFVALTHARLADAAE